MLKVTAFIFIFLFQVKGVYCQQNDAVRKHNNTAIVVEALGHARGLISVNYERIFHTRFEAINYTARAGIGYTPGSNESDSKGIVYFPVVAGALLGKGRNFGQVKIGYTGAIGQELIDTTYSRSPQNVKNESAYIISAGYRYMEYNGAVFEILPITLVWTNNPNQRFSWSVGLSIGYGF